MASGIYLPTLSELNPSTGLVCRPDERYFCKGFRDRAWHAPRAKDRSAAGTIVFPPFRRIEPTFTRLNWTSRSGSRCENAWTYVYTNISSPTFFQRPTRGILGHKAFKAKAPSYSTSLNWEIWRRLWFFSIFLNSELISKNMYLAYRRHFVFGLPWKGQNVTYGSEIGCGWIPNVKYLSLVFVAKLYSN